MVDDARERQKDLGAFVRARRESLAPADFGLSAGARRRTPGLRREEAAQLSGLSVTWYTWLEQGRDMSLSATALTRLANALRFGRAERAYLFDLAGKRDPDAGAAEVDWIASAVAACVDTIGAPAYLLDRSWSARHWNAPAERLFAGWLDRPGPRNLLRFLFLDPASRRLIRDHEERARRVVAEFRAAAGTHVTDPDIRGLVEELHRKSPAFARLWDAQAVLDREGGTRVFDHPKDGELRFQQVTFDLSTHPGLKLTMLVPEG
jgi:transcriptional regulator with XRE-family HTH domain